MCQMSEKYVILNLLLRCVDFGFKGSKALHLANGIAGRREPHMYTNFSFLMKSIRLLMIVGETHRTAHAKSSSPVIEDITDIKDFKKLIRTKNNVLVCYVLSAKKTSHLIKIVKEVGVSVKGQGTIVLVDCSTEAKKLCKKLKIDPDPAILKHYKDGEFHKNYDRKETASAMLNFMRDPSGDIPWAEEDVDGHIAHIPDSQALIRYLRKQSLPTLVMFYAPWCGFCKQLKPEFAAAAAALKGRAALAAIDVNQPENAAARTQFNITGFPTLLYFEGGVQKYVYEGENKKDSIIEFMKEPGAARTKAKGKGDEEAWSSDSNSAVTHLTDETFAETINSSDHALVMFYAPWCGHCKRMKPEYEKAAKLEAERDGTQQFLLAALDATREQSIAKQWSIRGYPTVKYFARGEYQFDVSVRTAEEIATFVANPQKPPPPPPPETPWAEIPSDVLHLGVEDFKSALRKRKHALVMFYAPWCGHCKKAKPEFTLAASELSEDPRVALAAVDCTAHSSLCSAYNVNGYPTIKLFHYLNKEEPVDYNGGRTATDFLKYMLPFTSLQLEGLLGSKSKKSSGDEEQWGSGAVSHYSGANFDAFVKEHDSALILFHAPWCSRCQSLKVAYVEAAKILKSNKIPCSLLAVDVAAYPDIGDRYNIVGLPSMKYFHQGKFIVDYKDARDSEAIVEFMKNPPIKPVRMQREEL